MSPNVSEANWLGVSVPIPTDSLVAGDAPPNTIALSISVEAPKPIATELSPVTRLLEPIAIEESPTTVT